MGSSLMSIGVRAMLANTAALDATSHNIANANVAGYSRQRAELATANGQFTGAGFIGHGVDVATVTRSHDQFLTREVTVAASLSAMDSARQDQLQRLQNAFGLGENGLGYAAGNFLNSLVDVANQPTDLPARQAVLSRAEEFASRLRDAGAQFDALQQGVTTSLQNSVTEANGLAASIAQVNQQIAAVNGSGHAPNDLLDERDRLIEKLSAIVQVSTVPADDGTVSVFVGGGQRLVLGTQAQKLSVVTDDYDRSRSAIAIGDPGSQVKVSTDQFGGGSIAGLLRFQNDDLVAARSRVGQIAAAVAGAVNERQSLGLDLLTPAGAGVPIFQAGATRVLPAATNAKDGTGNFIASPTLTVADASQLKASEYELRIDPAGAPGAWQLTRLSDGLSRTVVDGDTVDGFTLNLGTPAPASTDRFLLQPVTRASNDMKRVLDDPRGIAAASPVTATVPATNTGTAAVASLQVSSATVDPTLTADIAFTSNSGDYGWTLKDGSGTTISSGSGTWTAGSTLSINGFDLQLTGVPRNGDVVTVAPTPFPSANNGNAIAMMNLRDGAIVGGATVTDAYASALSDVGVRVQSATTAATLSANVATEAKSARDDATGVNLDEEAAKLIQYQQSYQAASKILQIAQSLFDSLLQVAR